MSKYKIIHDSYDSECTIEATSEDDAAEKYCEKLFNEDPGDVDANIEINGSKYNIWTEAVPEFCSRKI